MLGVKQALDVQHRHRILLQQLRQIGLLQQAHLVQRGVLLRLAVDTLIGQADFGKCNAGVAALVKRWEIVWNALGLSTGITTVFTLRLWGNRRMPLNMNNDLLMR